MAEAVREHLHSLGWAEPVVADSGNGFHLLYRVDLANDDRARDLVKRLLHTLGGRFSNEHVKLDENVFNAARIWKLYGTVACKGDSTPERPHRVARLIGVPDS